ncbi:unnamed protein product, partial [Medioppia subpectinata]
MSSANQLDPQLMQMIEHKRRLAIEKRNKRQAIESNATNAAPNKTQPTITSNPSASLMTNIKPKVMPQNTTDPKSSVKTNGSCSGGMGRKTEVKATIRLMSSKRFELNIGYNADVINVLRGIPSRDWNPSSKMWRFDMKDYKRILTDLQTISSVDIKFVDSVPDRVINALIEAINRPKEDIDLKERLSPQLISELFGFQVEGIVFGIRTGGRCLIADDMGLGKTLQAISIAQWFRDDWPLLIVCPSSLRYQWRDQINKWLPTVKEDDIYVVTKEMENLPKVLITIISYDLMARIKPHINMDCKQTYNFVILDESHYIKNDTAVRTDAVSLMAKASKRVILLTGTPALSRPMELFTQIKILNGKLFANKHEFGMRYCNGHLKHFWMRGARNAGKQKQIWDYNGAKNLDELKILLESTILLRRLKSQVLSQLPPKKREMIMLNLNHMSDKEKAKLKNYSNVVKKLSFRLDENTSHFDWYMDSAMAKVDPVCKYMAQLLNQNVKFLCFCHHKQMMDSIQQVLADMRVNHIRIDGTTSATDRQEACNEFQRVSDCRVALLSITACATGLNLIAASVVVFAELFWNPGILSQAEDRVHRIGQKNDVKIYYLVAKDTIDDMIWPMISKKLEVLNKAGLSKDNFEDT